MRPIYNLFAGRSLERLAALSDGVFAIAVTLLVLDLRVPPSHPNMSERELWSALVALSPRIVAYLLSFLTLGIFWVGQQTQLNHFARGDRNLAWIHLGFLLAVTLMPFSTGLLSAFIAYRVALAVYWLNIFLLGAMLFAGWRYARRVKLVREEVTEEVSAAVERRIIIAQGLYTFGAALCLLPIPNNTYISIAVIVLIQLNYAIAPQIRWLYRL